MSPDWSRQSRNNGYLIVYCPTHPRAWSSGYVYVHVVIAEEKLGRYLQDGEVVHHKDRDKLNNDPNNLAVCTQREHIKIHALNPRPSVLRLTCDNCGQIFTRRAKQRRELKGYAHAFCSHRCNGQYHALVVKRTSQLSPKE